jgi:hypothetical protein
MELDGVGSYSLWENATGNELNMPELQHTLSDNLDGFVSHESTEQLFFE